MPELWQASKSHGSEPRFHSRTIVDGLTNPAVAALVQRELQPLLLGMLEAAWSASWLIFFFYCLTPGGAADCCSAASLGA